MIGGTAGRSRWALLRWARGGVASARFLTGLVTYGKSVRVTGVFEHISSATGVRMEAVAVSRGIMAVLTATVLLLGAATATAQAEPTDPPESAAPCEYPSVCFVKDGVVVYEYDEVIPWQYLPDRLPAPLQVVNTRHESVWIGDTKGGVECVRPGTVVDKWLGTLETVRIDDSVECRLI